MKQLHITALTVVIALVGFLGFKHSSPVSALDLSPQYFTVGSSMPFIHLNSPNGGEVLLSGSTYPILWNSSSDIYQVSLFYFLGSSTIPTPIVTNIANNQAYVWTVNVNTGNTLPQVKIFVLGYQASGSVVSDQSDNYFTVLPAFTPTPTLIPAPTITRPQCTPVICRPGVRCPMRPECVIETM